MITGKRFSSAIQELKGLPVLEWRNGYGDSGSLHLGKPSSDRLRSDDRVSRARGQSILTVWEASVAFRDRPERQSPLRSPPLELRNLNIGSIAGVRISNAHFAEESGVLTIVLASGANLTITPSARSQNDEDQWVIESLQHGTHVVRTGPTIIEET
jgi:hypothetical protein